MENLLSAMGLMEQVKSLLHVELYNVFTSKEATSEEKDRIYALSDRAYWLGEELSSLIHDIEDGEVLDA